MHQSSQLDRLQTGGGGQVSGKKKTPLDVGNSLFRDLIAREGRLETGDWGGVSLSGGPASRKGVGGKEEDPLKGLDGKGRYAGIAYAQIRLPGTAAARLIPFLEKKGLSRESIDQLILSATDREGMIHLDRVMVGAGREKVGPESPGGYRVVRSEDVPRVQAMLFRLGLGAAEVKKAIERSLSRKGDLRVDRLSDALGRVFPQAPTEKDLASLMGRLDIKSTGSGAAQGLDDPRVMSAFKALSAGVPQDVQKKIKQELGQLLRQKGVPPEEVKSFLENLSVGYARTVLGQKGRPLGGPQSEKATGQVTDFLDRVVIKSRPEWDQGGWQDRILKILKGEKIAVFRGGGIEDFKDGLLVRLNGGKPPAKGDPLTRGVGPDLISVHGKGSRQEMEPGRQGFAGPLSIKGERHSEFAPAISMKHALGEAIQLPGAVQGRSEVRAPDAGRGTNPLPQPLPRILDRMIWMIQGGEQKGRVQLSPPELGRLDLDLVIRQGHIQANLSAESAAVKEIIEQNLSQLRQQLADQGFIVDKFEVSVGLGERRFHEGDTRTGAQKRPPDHRGTRKGSPVIRAGEAPSSGPGNPSSRIDVHV